MIIFTTTWALAVVGLGHICMKMAFAKSNFISRLGKMLAGSFPSDAAFRKLAYLPLLPMWSCQWTVNKLPYAISRCRTPSWTPKGSRDFNITLKSRFQCVPGFTKHSKVILWTETQWIWWREKMQTWRNVLENITDFWSPSNVTLSKYHFRLPIWSPLKIENPFIVTWPSVLNKEVFHLVMSFLFYGWKFIFIHPSNNSRKS